MLSPNALAVLVGDTPGVRIEQRETGRECGPGNNHYHVTVRAYHQHEHNPDQSHEDERQSLLVSRLRNQYTPKLRKRYRERGPRCPLPTHRTRAVYHKPSLSVRALAYLSKSLSRSFLSTAMSDRYGTMSSAFQRARVRNRSEKRVTGSDGSSAQGK